MSPAEWRGICYCSGVSAATGGAAATSGDSVCFVVFFAGAFGGFSFLEILLRRITASLRCASVSDILTAILLNVDTSQNAKRQPIHNARNIPPRIQSSALIFGDAPNTEKTAPMETEYQIV